MDRDWSNSRLKMFDDKFCNDISKYRYNHQTTLPEQIALLCAPECSAHPNSHWAKPG
ncbi:hypothetical protein CA13_39120 [Planctomycetes bacterium CA13]|uniref:Uncharacterized protein n=1 Tax=Novipirellula herctigrandis TaxID=2527986 RepID=A0A5C5Z4Y0_9BACT|nr:hypothetical protein CA13_39120 [Planctomycetes bacterium CA13]